MSPRLCAQLGLLALALALLAWRDWPDARLKVTFLDVSGDGVLIQTPTGGFILVDGGADPSALSASLGKHMPFWQRTLDAVVLTAGDTRRLVGQVAALNGYRTRLALAPPAVVCQRGTAGCKSTQSPILDEWRRLFTEQQTTVRVPRPGERIEIGGVWLRFLAAGESQLIMRLEYGTTSVVLAGATNTDAETALLASGTLRPASLLAYPWERDPNNRFVATLHPRAIVFTDGYEADRPVELSYADRAAGGVALYHERIDHTITWISDGQRAWVETGR